MNFLFLFLSGHGTSFNIDCNICSCFAGNLVCSTRLCLSADSSEDDRRTFTGLPCNCADQFVPVCGQNGRTYPSACIARCVGLQDHQFEFGSCISKDPCNPNPCPKNQRCIPKPQVCLTTFDKFGCSQYECLPRQLTCDQVRDPVCDTNHMEHNNLCTLYQRGKSLLYKGPCQVLLFAWQPKCAEHEMGLWSFIWISSETPWGSPVNPVKSRALCPPPKMGHPKAGFSS